MPQLFPPVSSFNDIKNDGEREVIEQLMEQLPDTSRIYHSFELLTTEHRKGDGAEVRIKEGEIDAIVVLPNRSIVVLEVKGRGLRYDKHNNLWMRSNGSKSKTERSPFKQARSNARKLMNCLEVCLGEAVVETLSHGYIVVFPFSNVKGALTHDMKPAVYCNADDMQQLGKKVQAVARKMSSSKPNPALSILDIHQALLPDMQIVRSLKVSVDADVDVLLRLTQEQTRNLNLLSKRKRALIEGVAGSGKSVLAVEQARRFADQGKKVLLLCYNSALASWIGSGIYDELEKNPVQGSVEVKTFHDFCATSCKEAKVEFKPEENPGVFWEETAPDQLSKCSHLEEYFDAIIVDEGQDFHGLWWLPIQGCLKQDGALFVFCDPGQDLYNANGLSELDMGSDTFPLELNCRNTINIARFCDDIAEISTESHPDAPEGEEVIFKTITDEQSRVDYVRNVIARWVGVDKICPSKIAVLSPRKPTNTCLHAGVNSNVVSLTTDAAEWRLGNGVFHSTVRGFKGLDAEFVILVDLPVPGSHPVFRQTDYYVGASRAKAVLHVVAKEAGFERLDQAA